MGEKSGLVEIRWHGRGGQGAVTSAELLAQAAINEGKYAQAFPAFGAERRGAPVIAFLRIDDSRPIRVRAEVTEPDGVVVLDASLLRSVNVIAGFKTGGVYVVNSNKPPEAIVNGSGIKGQVAIVDATKIARENLELAFDDTKWSVTLRTDIPFGHKFSLAEIKPNDPVIKYGEVIGLATAPIAPGDYVHVHNIASARARGDLKGDRQ